MSTLDAPVAYLLLFGALLVALLWLAAAAIAAADRKGHAYAVGECERCRHITARTDLALVETQRGVKSWCTDCRVGVR